MTDKTDNNQLQVILQASGLEQTKSQYILDQFTDYFRVAAEWESKAKGLVVTDETDTATMAMARTGRLYLREKRIAIEKARVKLKEQALREGKAIDGVANVLKGLIVPIEEYLERQEKFVEIREAAKAEALRIEAETKAEAERIAEEKRVAAEQEAMRLENLQLKAEAEAKDKAIAEQKRKAEADKLKAEVEVQRLKAEAEAKLKAEREKVRVAEEARGKAEQVIREQALANEIECPYCHRKFETNVTQREG